jgi:hypothetical protein
MVCLGNDCSLIMLSGFQFADISAHCKPLSQVRHAKGCYGGKISNVSHFNEKLKVKDKSGTIWLNDYWTLQGDHKGGDCGLPLIAEVQGGSSIVGIHAAGGDHCNTIVIASFPLNVKEKAQELAENSGLLKVSSESRLGFSFRKEMNKKSAVHYEDMGNIVVYGTLDEPVMMNHKSKLKKTLFYKHVHEMLYDQMDFIAEETFGAPPMRPFKNQKGEWISPYNIALRKMNKNRGHADRKTLRKTIRIILRNWTRKMRKRGVTKLSPIPLQEAINGAREDYYTRRLDQSKGAGFGLKGKKKDHFVLGEMDLYEPDDNLMQKVLDRKERYLRGENCPIIFTGMPKDEPREVKKIEIGKTRLFYAGMLDSLIVAKQFLSPMYTLMSQYRLDFGCALGVDPHREAKSLAEHLLYFSKKVPGDECLVEGDYAGYDLSMCPDITWAAYSIIYHFLKEFGYTDDALKIVQGLLSDFMHPVLHILGDLIMVMMTPSGKYGTAEDNTVKGAVIIVFLFISHPQGKDLDPFEHLAPLIYGDDMLTAVSPECEWFNNFYFSEACARYLGMTFTSALKGDHTAGYVKIFESSFLRRHFIYEGGMWKMPLTMNSAEKTIGWIIPSRVASEQDQILNAFNSFLREVYLTIPKNKFNKVRKWGKDIFVKEYELQSPVIQTYDEIKASLEREDTFTTESITVTEEEQYEFEDRDGKFFSDNFAFEFLIREQTVVAKTVIHLFIARAWGIEVSRLPQVLQWPTEFNYYLKGEIDTMRTDLLQIEEKAPSGMEELAFLSRSEIVSLSRYGTDKDYRTFCDNCMNYRAKRDGLRLSIETLERAFRRSTAFSTESAEGYLEPDGSMQEVKNENLVDMSGGSMDVLKTTPSQNVDVGQDVPLSIRDFLSRPVRIAAYSNTPGITLNEAINPWDALLSQPSVRAKLRNTAYLRADLHVRISVSGMPFHYGRYLFSYLPFPDYNEPFKELQTLVSSALSGAAFGELVYLSQSPYARSCDVVANEPVEMVIPYLSPQPVMRLFNNSTSVMAAVDDFQDATALGVLYLKSINDLKSTNATSTPVSLAVYAWLENVEFGSPTATQLEVTTESDERITGPISSATKSMSEAAWAMSDVPVIGSYAKASGRVLQGVSDMSSALGWSYPTLIDEPMRMKSEPFQNAATSIGMDTGKRIVLDPKQELSVDLRSAGSDEDDLVISNIVKRESLLTTFTWAASDNSLSGPNKLIAVTPYCAST